MMLLLAPVAVMAASHPVTSRDYRALVRIRSPQFSPDGQQLAFLTVRPDFVHDRYAATPQNPVHLELYDQAINQWVVAHLGH